MPSQRRCGGVPADRGRVISTRATSRRSVEALRWGGHNSTHGPCASRLPPLHPADACSQQSLVHAAGWTPWEPAGKGQAGLLGPRATPSRFYHLTGGRGVSRERVCRRQTLLRVSDADGTACCGAQNSSLVLTADSRSSRGQNEGTGEPETLWGRINPKGFGDRAGAGKKEDLEEMKTKAKSKYELLRCVSCRLCVEPVCCAASHPSTSDWAILLRVHAS